MSSEKSETKSVTFRLKSGLIELLDEKIRGVGFYSNKPDFILYALREYYEFNMMMFPVVTRALDGIIKSGNAPAQTNYLSTVYVRITSTLLEYDYQDFVGDPVVVLVRVPIGFYDTLQSYIKGTEFFKNIQDYTQKAIMYTLDADRCNSMVQSAIMNKDRDQLSKLASLLDIANSWGENIPSGIGVGSPSRKKKISWMNPD